MYNIQCIQFRKKKKKSKVDQVMQAKEKADARETKRKVDEQTPAEKAFVKIQEKRVGV